LETGKPRQRRETRERREEGDEGGVERKKRDKGVAR
jgi:hypothetical protein